jgi:dipeptidyl aminopeptidase/acylaminoacyl peptidase
MGLEVAIGRSTALVLLLGSSIGLQAQSFSIEDILSAPFPSQLTTAAHANRIAWVFDDKGARNVWTAAGPDFHPQQITHYVGDDGQPLASLRLTPDGKTIVYARGSEVNEAGRAANTATDVKQPTQAVWAVDIVSGIANGKTANPRLLGEMGCPEEGCEDIELSPDGKYAIWSAKHGLWLANLAGEKAHALTDLRGNADSAQWSPDGAKLAFVLDRGDHSFIVIADVRDGQLSAIHYVAPSVDRDAIPRWSSDGKHLAFIRSAGSENHQPIIPERAHPWSICIADSATYATAELWHSGEQPRDSLPPFLNTTFQYAGDRIVFDSEQDGWNHLYSIDASHPSKPILLTPGEFDVEDVFLSADKSSLLYSSNQNDPDRRHLWRVAVAGEFAPTALTSGETIEWTPVETGVGSQLLCLGSTATSPGMVYKVSGGSRELVTKDALPSSFPGAALVTPKQVIFQSSDGYSIHGQLFSPKTPNKARAALIFVHGGPSRQMLLGFHYMQYYANAYAENQYLASLGFTVLSVNYRLGIMYGHDFREAPDSGWRGSAEYNDVLAGAAYLRSLQEVDASHIGIWGGSYGGLLTALALSRNSNLFAAGVDFHGVHDWSIFVNPWQSLAASAPDHEAAAELAWRSSPDASIANWKSPILLIQGDDDRNVPFNQMVDLVQRLRAQNVPFEQIVYPDEIHDFLLHRHFVEAYKSTAEFLQRKLQARQ